MHKLLSARIIGFVGSLILTIAAFLIVAFPKYFHLNNKMAMVAILSLALIQSVVQSVFFLDILSEKGPRWNLLVFGSTISIILIIIVFSIWIMNQLNYNMMI